MCARAGLELAAVDPAYTSKNSKSWIKLTSTRARETTGHQAASLAIARRGLALSLSCRKGVTKDKQRIVNRELPTRRRNQALSLITDSLTDQRRPSTLSKSTDAKRQTSPLRPILAYLTKPKTIRGLGLTRKNCQLPKERSSMFIGTKIGKNFVILSGRKNTGGQSRIERQITPKISQANVFGRSTTWLRLPSSKIDYLPSLFFIGRRA